MERSTTQSLLIAAWFVLALLQGAIAIADRNLQYAVLAVGYGSIGVLYLFLEKYR